MSYVFCDCATKAPTYPVFRSEPHLPECPLRALEYWRWVAVTAIAEELKNRKEVVVAPTQKEEKA